MDKAKLSRGPSIGELVPHEPHIPFKEWIATLKVEEIATPNVIIVSSNDSVKNAFETLVNNRILSAPVFDLSSKKIVGLIDLVDIITFIIEQLGDESLSDDLFALQSKLESTKNNFITKPITIIAEVTKKSSFHSVPTKSSLLEVAKQLAEGAPRVYVAEGEKLISLITQSTFLTFCYKHMGRFFSLAKKKLSELDLVNNKQLVSVNVEDKAIDAFRILHKEKLNALAVLDEDNKLLTNISLRDLKGLKSQNYLFSKLYLPVIELLKVVRSEDVKDRAPVIAVKVTDTFQYAVTKLSATRIHQLYVKDEEDNLTGVIFISDVIKRILHS